MNEKRRQYMKAWIRQRRAMGFYKDINRRSLLKTKYGLTPKDYNALLASQGGVCAICRRRPAHRLCVDHDHQTGKVRGLLCACCNGGVGQFRDDPTLLRLAADYLEASV